MTWANYDHVVEQLRDGGLDLDGGIEVGTTNPVRCFEKDGDKEKRAWYWLSEITLNNERYIVGSYGIYRGNDAGKIKITLPKQAPALSDDQKAAIRARQAEDARRMKAMREAKHQRAAAEAARVWAAYVPTGKSDYLERKGVQAHGLRFDPGGHGTVLVPMTDAAGRIWGLQIIRGKNRGEKLEKQYFPKGMNKGGHYHLIGTPRDVVLIAEGYATAATLHEATGLPVAVAFDANSLRPVAESIHKTYRKARIMVCADDDYLTEGNPGCAAASAAALACSGAWCRPEFPADREGKKLTDFNDLAAFPGGGPQAVRVQIEAAIALAGWSVPQASARGATTGGAGSRTALASMIQLEEALERFTMIYGSGGTWFDGQEHMLVPKSDLQDILPEHGMRDMRARKKVARLDGVGFDPAGTDSRIVCNLWGGWPTVPSAGTCNVLLDLLLHLCGDEPNADEVFLWVLRWLAYPIQHPGAKMRTALVFHGPQGTGKNLFFEAVMAIYGEYGRIVDQSAVEDKFNDWASRKLFLIADEVVARAELFHVKNKLKGIVTGEWIRINPKNVAAHDERNHVNLVFLSNEPQPLVLEQDDRRYTVIKTPAKLPEDFYDEVKAEIAAGGIAALHDHLLNLDLGDFNEHTKPPMTEAKKDLIDISMGSVEQFVRNWMDGEIVSSDGKPLPFCPCGSADLYAVYLRQCRETGVARPREMNQFIGTLAGRTGWWRGHKDRLINLNQPDKKRQRMVIPATSDMELVARMRWDDQDRRPHPEDNQTAWISRCFFAVQGWIEAAP